MIEKMMNFNSDKWAGFFLLGVIDLIILSVVVALWDKAKKNYGYDFSAHKDGSLGELVSPKKATAKQKRNVWLIFYTLLGIFVIYTYMMFNDRKLWN